MAHFETEREGLVAFYKAFLKRIDPTLSLDEIIGDNNDGVLNGNLLEFKLRVGDLNATLFQCVKYLSARRIKGKPVPASIIIVDLNAEQAYLYKSADYLSGIEKVYSGAASKSNAGFVGRGYDEKLAYGANQIDAARLIERMRETHFTRIHIDENCIVGWAAAYYRAVPSARKEDFLGDGEGKHKTVGEIRKPSIFSEYIYPYKGGTNVRFQYLMDRLNDTLQKKNLGAFYTPEAYAGKSHELLREAIARVPDGNDYVIIDRCAGTGNLEQGLSEEELSHCILSTVEYYEYKVMLELLGSKVRHIIPPIESDDTFNAGLVRGADALSEDYINNPIIRQYIDDQKCTIILFENPPYAETTSVEHQRKGAGKKSSGWKGSFVVTEMRKQLKGAVTNDLGNAFIWSAFEYYLREPTDSYVVYSPIKYWKAQHLIDRKFLRGFAFNRKHFHTNIDACVSAILWSAERADVVEFDLEGYDIDREGGLVACGKLPVKRISTRLSDAYYERGGEEGDTDDGICVEFDGTECLSNTKKIRVRKTYNEDMLGYLVAMTAGFDNPDLNTKLLSAEAYNGNGFILRMGTFITKLPMFCAGRYITYNREWTERARIMKSGDGAAHFNIDVKSGRLDQWLLRCLLFACVEMQNHMRTFTGSDGRFYRNELCMDTTNGPTVASGYLELLVRDADDVQILDQWNVLLDAAKRTDEYDQSLTYGVYQIFAEIDTSYKDEQGNIVWNNIEVHSALQTLKKLVRDYYNKKIVPNLFTYEFLK